MPDSRSHRGAHPKDAADFSPDRLPTLRRSVAELSWLLTRGYPQNRSVTLVGDRHSLRERQRKATGRVAASRHACEQRGARRIEPEQVAGSRVDVDGYNVLLTVEAALGGGVLLPARDQTLRDLAAMSRHYKKVEETLEALRLLGDFLHRHGAAAVHWYLDRPISNSGRLRAMMIGLAERQGWPWQVELVANPDPLLKASEHTVVTADSAILDAGARWLNLARHVVEDGVENPWWVDLLSELPEHAPRAR